MPRDQYTTNQEQQEQQQQQPQPQRRSQPQQTHEKRLAALNRLKQNGNILYGSGRLIYLWGGESPNAQPLRFDKDRQQIESTFGITIDDDLLKLLRDSAQPLTVARYSYRIPDGLIIGLHHDVFEDGLWSLLLTGDDINLVPAGYGRVMVIGGGCPGISIPHCICGPECADGRPHFKLPDAYEPLIPCTNVSLGLTPAEVRSVLAVWDYVVTLDKRGKPILIITGQQGSLKTGTARSLVKQMEGLERDVSILPKSPHDLAVTANKHRVIALDNVETRGWLPDMVTAIATGAQWEARKLYSDGETVSFDIRSGLIITSIDVPFNRQDVIDRSIVFEQRRVGGFLSEDVIEARMRDQRHAIWQAKLHDLNHIIQLERDRPSAVIGYNFRMADYAAVGSLVWDEPQAERILSALVKAQSRITLRDDAVMERLAALARERGVLTGSAGQLRDMLVAPFNEAPPEARTAKKLGGHLRRMQDNAKLMNLDISWADDPHLNQLIYTIKWAKPTVNEPASFRSSTEQQGVALGAGSI